MGYNDDRHIDDGMRHGGLVPTKTEREEERLRKRIEKLEDERDVFKRTLDKRDEDLAVIGERLDYAVGELRDIIGDAYDIDPRMRYVEVQIGRGTLEGLRSWLKTIEISRLREELNTQDDLIKKLENQ